MEKIYAVDALNFLFRAHYAIAPMTNEKGASTQALFGFIRSLTNLIKTLHPTHFVIVFDGPENKKSRLDIFPDYKGHRKAMPEELVPQVALAMDFCRFMGWPILISDGVEADDVLGSIAFWSKEKAEQVFIVSSDKDLCQLVSDKIFLINAAKDNKIIDRKEVEEMHGVPPEKIVDYLALTGDGSDGIPGLEGFGPKTASALLNEYGSLENLLNNADNVKGEKKQKTLREGKELALLCKKLATIDCHVAFPKEESFFIAKSPDKEKLTALYQEMGFHTLLKTLEIPEDLPAKKTTLINSCKEFEELIERLLQEKEIALDTETDALSPRSAKIVGVGLGTLSEEVFYVPANGNIPRKLFLSGLETLLESVPIFGHNIKYDCHALENEGISSSMVSFDTMIASYLLRPENHRHNLDDLTFEKYNVVKTPIKDLLGSAKEEKSMQDVDIPLVCDYCGQDVLYTIKLKKLFSLELKKTHLDTLFESIELPLIPVLKRMERAGIYLDGEELKKIGLYIAAQISELEKAIQEDAGEDFNVNSPKQLGVILFEKLKIPVGKKTQTGYSTDASTLEKLEGKHPIIEKIQRFRHLEKMRSTYIDALSLQINEETGRVHCTFNQSVAATGRLSAQNPNLQNIPVKSELGKEIRSCFKAKTGYSFLSADYSQIELRLLAHLSDDPNLCYAFNHNKDVHSHTASLVFGVDESAVTKEMRQKAKAVNFGIIYGQQAFGLAQNLGISNKEAAKFIEEYFVQYPGVKKYLDNCKEIAKKTGKVETILGRVRPLPELQSKNPMIRAMGERLAVNAPLQGANADLIKIAMIRIDQKLQKNKYLGTMLLQIHDELLFEVEDQHIDALTEMVRYEMQSVFPLKVPLLVEINVGKNWGKC